MRRPPDTPRGRPGQETAPQDDARGDGISASVQRDRLLELSDERDLQMELRLEAYREGWRACWAIAYAEGRHDEGAERDEAWRVNAGFIAAQLDPDGPKARELARQRLRAAESGSRRDADEHWDEFMQRAAATAPDLRSDAQAAAVRLTRKGRSA